MNFKRERDDVRVLLSVAACFQSFIRPSRPRFARKLKLKERFALARAAFSAQKIVPFPTKNLTRQERFTSFKAGLDFKKAARENRHAKSKPLLLAAALEALVPFYKKGYGEENLMRSLSAIARRETSIEHLRRLGANGTADLCEKARKAEQRRIAVQRENAVFLAGVWKKMRASEVKAVDLIKKEPRQKRSPSSVQNKA